MNNKLVSLIIISFVIILLSACVNETEESANNIVEAIKNENYEEAQQIYDDAVYGSDEPNEVRAAVSNSIIDYLDNIYGDYYDSSKEESFYNILDNIESLGIDDDELTNEISEFRGLQDGSYSEDENYSNQDDTDEVYDDTSYDSYDSTQEDSSYEEEEEVSTDNPYTATDIDHDCPDFATQEDAQLFYIANGGSEDDPHDLDRDGDGMACDWNP
jgi:hypothetical protein